MVLARVPAHEAALTRTTGGGTPYGASHVSGSDGRASETSDDENAIAKALGRRLATLAYRLGRTD